MKKDFNFEAHPWESFVFFDIETVARVPELEENTPLYDSFEYKMRYTEEAQRKDFGKYNLKALYAQKAALYPEFGKIACITVGKIVDGKIVIYTFSGEEKQMLIKFHKWLGDRAAADPNLALCGVNIKFFDLRYIYIRSVVHQVVPVKGHISFTGFKPWEIKVADITDVWKQTSPYNAPMITMAEVLGLPSPKNDIDGSKVSHVYWNEGEKGLKRIITYCEDDVFTTVNIARRLRFEPLLERADAEETKEAAAKKDELPHIIRRIYNLDAFDEKMQQEVKDLIGKKRLTKKDKTNLRTILLGVYLRTDFVNQDQDTKAVKEAKTEEVDNFINSL